MKTHTVIYLGGAQTIRTTPTESDGEPMILVSAEARIVDLRVSEDSADRVIVARAAAALDATTDTLTAAVGLGAPSRTRIEVSTPASFTEGRSYALVDPDGYKQEIVVDHVDGSAVYARNDIRHNFAIGSTLRGFEISYTFPSSEADDEQALLQHEVCPYAVDWFFTDGDPSQQRELIYMRRNPRPVLARAADVEMLDIEIGKLTKRGNQMEQALEQAHRDFWRLIEARSIDADTAYFGEHGRDWIVRMSAAYVRRSFGTERDDAMASMYEHTANGIMASLGGFGQTMIDKTSDQAVGDPSQRILWPLT